MTPETKTLWGASMGVGVVNLELVEKRVPKVGRLLDAGCGLGFVVSSLSAGKRYGIDDKPLLVAAAKKMNPEVEYSVQDIAKTSFAGGFFDTVLCLDVIEHTTKQRATLSELSRILAPGGRLLLSTPVPEADFLPGARAYTRALHKAWGHKKLVSRDRLIKMLDEAGLTVEDEVYYMYLPARLGIFVYNIIYALFAGESKPWNSLVIRVYERILKLMCKLDNAIKFFGPFEVLFVAVKN